MTRTTYIKQSLSALLLSTCAIQSANAAIALSDNTVNPAQNNYNLLIGTMQYNFSSKTSFRYDSNYNRDSTDDESMAIIPGIGVQAYWPITPNLIFTSGVNVSYVEYLDDDAESGLLISGGGDDATAKFDFDFLVGDDSIITVSNTASSSVDILNIGESLGRVQENEPFNQINLGSNISYKQRLTPYSLVSLSYGASYSFATDSEFEAVDRFSHGPKVRAASEINDNTVIGISGSAKFSTASESIQNDSVLYRLAGDVEYTSDSGFLTTLEIGVDFHDYENNNSNTSDNEKTSPYVSGKLNFLTGEFLTHSVTAKYSVEHSNASIALPTINLTPQYGYTPLYQSVQVNYQEVISLGYGVSYLVTPDLDLKFNYTFESIDQSENGNSYNISLISLGTDYTLNDKAKVGLSYTYEDLFDSDFLGTEYDRHIVQVSFRYNF